MSAAEADVSAGPAAPKVAPEAVALRARPRPVVRLNRRTLAVLGGGMAAFVMGATIWSLQPKAQRKGGEPAELYNVDRVSKSEGLGRLGRVDSSHAGRIHDSRSRFQSHEKSRITSFEAWLNC